MSKERQFGLLLGAVLGVIGLWPLFHAESPRLWSLVPAAALLVAALFLPGLLRHPLKWWMKLGELLHVITSPLLMGLIFFVVFTPVSLLLRLLRKRPIAMGPDRARKTYWIPREQPAPGKGSMEFGF